MMLTKLKIQNFRCYENSTITFQRTSILVGRNNAGKSTLIEALKILSEVSKKYKTSGFSAPPSWVSGEPDNGFSPSIDRLSISDRGLFYMYRNPPAVIEATFSNGAGIKVFIGEGTSVFAQVFAPDGTPARNSKEAKTINLPTIEVLPQISAVLDTEVVLKNETVERNMSTRLASRNFRNQLLFYPQYFPRFKQMAEDTWEHLQVKSLEKTISDSGQTLQFYIRDNAFESEIGWMGHGLQMWLQTMWFISRCDEHSIVVLDEPDVYMHADLQRRLIRLVSSMFSQLIVATHSVEIMEEVTSNSIIPIDSKRRQIKPIGKHHLLEKLTDEMGSAFNLDLSRMFLSKRFMIWEGEDTDRQILSAFQSVLFPRDLHPISSFPKIYVEGWGGRQRALAVAEVFNQNRIGIKCYCIFDSDYHLEEDIEERKEEALRRNINLHIWSRKEIENYVIHPAVILRYIQKNKRKGQITEDILSSQIEMIVDSMKDEFIQDVAEEIRMKDKQLSVKSSMAQAKQRVEERLKKNPLSVLPGKTLLKQMSQWSHTLFGVAISATSLVRYFRAEEVPEEIRNTITTIIDGGIF